MNFKTFAAAAAALSSVAVFAGQECPETVLGDEASECIVGLPPIAGQPVAYMSYEDVSGKHKIVLTESDITHGKGYDEAKDFYPRDKQIDAYDFVFDASAGTWQKKWKIHDFYLGCEYDIDVKFVKNKVRITDLNKNGHKEVWVPYIVNCSSDVSPIPFKVIMYENGVKHSLRGTARVQVGENEYEGGSYSEGDAMKGAGKEIRAYGKQFWQEATDYRFW